MSQKCARSGKTAGTASPPRGGTRSGTRLRLSSQPPGYSDRSKQKKKRVELEGEKLWEELHFAAISSTPPAAEPCPYATHGHWHGRENCGCCKSPGTGTGLGTSQEGGAGCPGGLGGQRGARTDGQGARWGRGDPAIALPGTARASAGRCCSCRGASPGSRGGTAWGTAPRRHLGTQRGEPGTGTSPVPSPCAGLGTGLSGVTARVGMGTWSEESPRTEAPSPRRTGRGSTCSAQKFGTAGFGSARWWGRLWGRGEG